MVWTVQKCTEMHRMSYMSRSGPHRTGRPVGPPFIPRFRSAELNYRTESLMPQFEQCCGSSSNYDDCGLFKISQGGTDWSLSRVRRSEGCFRCMYCPAAFNFRQTLEADWH